MRGSERNLVTSCPCLQKLRDIFPWSDSCLFARQCPSIDTEHDWRTRPRAMVRRWRQGVARVEKQKGTPMENFEFVSPTHFVFGRGAEEQVGEKLAAAGAKRVLVHFGGGSAVASGLIDRVGASLDAAGIEHLELGGVRPNPEIMLVREGVRLCKEANVDWILAVGGGSVIDSAKAIANGACVDGDVWELFETKATRSRCAAHRRGAHHPGRRQRGVEEHGHLQRRAGPQDRVRQQRPAPEVRLHEPRAHLHPAALPDSRRPHRHVLPPAGALLRRRGRGACDRQSEPVAHEHHPRRGAARAGRPRQLRCPRQHHVGRHALPSGARRSGPPRGLGHPRAGARTVGAEPVHHPRRGPGRHVPRLDGIRATARTRRASPSTARRYSG